MLPLARSFYSLISERKHAIIDGIVIFVLSLVPFWGMGLEGIWVRGDAELYLDPVQDFRESLYAWNRLVSTGYGREISIDIQYIWYKALWAALYNTGFSLALIQRIFLTSSLAFLGCAMYYLANSLFRYKNSNERRIVGITVALFTIFNPYNVQRALFGILIPYSINLASSAIIFAFLVKGFESLETHRRWYRYAILISVFSVPMLTMHASLALLSLFLLSTYVLSKIMIYLMNKSFKQILHCIKFISLTSLSSIMLNSWWLLPNFDIVTNIGGPGYPYGSDPNIIYIVGENLSRAFVSFFRLQLLLSPLPELPNLSFWVTSPSLILTGILLTILVFLAIMLKKDHIILFLMIISLLSLGLSVGINPPLGFLYKLLWDIFPIFRVFYAADKFLHISVLCYALLLGATTKSIYERVSGIKRVIAVMAITGLVFTNAIPMLSGNFFGIITTTTVPDYWYKAADWLRVQNENFRIFVVPQNEWTTTWAKYIFPKPVLDGKYRGGMVAASGTPIAWEIYDLLLTNKTNNIGKLLVILNVKYILLVNETISAQGENRANFPFIAYLKSILDRQGDLIPVATFGKLTFYENLEYEDATIYGTNILLELSEYLQPMVIITHLATIERAKITKFAVVTSNITPATDSGLRKINSNEFLVWKYLPAFESLEQWKDKINVISIQTVTKDKVHNNTHLQITSDIREAGGLSGLWYMPFNNIDLSRAEFIRFWFKSDSSDISRTYIAIRDTQGNYNIYYFSYKSPATWQQVTISLGKPTPGWTSTKPPDLSKISGIQWVIFTNVPQNVTWYIGDIEVGEVRIDPIVISYLQNLRHIEPTLQYKIINPTMYIVKAHSDGPFVLIFSESFNEGWKASVKDSGTELKHFAGNLYANAFYVNKIGDFEIVLYYEPQTMLDTGLFISAGSLLILLTLLAVTELRSRRSRNNQ